MRLGLIGPLVIPVLMDPGRPHAPIAHTRARPSLDGPYPHNFKGVDGGGIGGVVKLFNTRHRPMNKKGGKRVHSTSVGEYTFVLSTSWMKIASHWFARDFF